MDAKRSRGLVMQSQHIRNDVLEDHDRHRFARVGNRSPRLPTRATGSGFETPSGVDRPSAEPSLAK